MSSRTKYLLGGAVLLGKQSFDWSKREILAEESEQYYNHINECHDIQLKTKSGTACDWTYTEISSRPGQYSTRTYA